MVKKHKKRNRLWPIGLEKKLEPFIWNQNLTPKNQKLAPFVNNFISGIFKPWPEKSNFWDFFLVNDQIQFIFFIWSEIVSKLHEWQIERRERKNRGWYKEKLWKFREKSQFHLKTNSNANITLREFSEQLMNEISNSFCPLLSTRALVNVCKFECFWTENFSRKLSENLVKLDLINRNNH